MHRSFYLSRYICDVLSEMRTLLEGLNVFTIYRYKKTLPSLIEEVQIMANRMEEGLYAQKEVTEMRQEWKKLKVEVEEMEKKLDKDREKE